MLFRDESTTIPQKVKRQLRCDEKKEGLSLSMLDFQLARCIKTCNFRDVFRIYFIQEHRIINSANFWIKKQLPIGGKDRVFQYKTSLFCMTIHSKPKNFKIYSGHPPKLYIYSLNLKFLLINEDDKYESIYFFS